MTTDPQIEITRLKFTICEQAAEINRQRDEIDRLLGWINGDADALTTLQARYLDPEETTTNRIKAAASALAYERAKAASTLVVIDFRERVRQARLKASEPKIIEHQPTP